MSNAMQRLGRALLLITLTLPLVAQAKVQMLDRIVAVVNDGAIMASELDDRVADIAQQIEQSGQQLPPPAIMREQVLNRMILERIQLQLADRAGIKVDDTSLNQALTGIARQNQMTLEEFSKRIRAEGQDWSQFREHIRQQMAISRLQQRSVGPRIHITDREVDRFLNSEMGKKMFQADFHLGHILVRVPAKASPGDIQTAKAKADKLVKKLHGGANFRDLAISDSDGPKALDGGDLGWRPAAQWPSLFSQAAIKLKKGEIAGPLRSGAGFHILKLIDRRGGAQKVVTQYKVRHILIKSDALTTPEQAHQRAQSVHDRIASGKLDFAKAAEQYSDDPGSARNGGELGWVSKGQMVPEFEDMMLHTPQGKLSPVFETQFGWHFLEVEGKRNADMSDEYRRTEARHALQKRRYEEELDNWIQEQRSDAYVDIRL
ncbi:MAG: peptidylprolyl isomerase [Alcanivorax sp.]|nr:peptidylprolyl isomerase [Alcanivorax sp.]